MIREGEEGDKFYIVLAGSCSVQVAVKRIDGKTTVKELGILRQGDCFGELALISHQPRVASVMCREYSHFATLSRDDYDRILSKVQDRLLQTKIEIITKQPVFRKLSKNLLQRLTYFFRIVRYKRKQEVFAAGAESEFLYIVKEGEFELVKDVELRHVAAGVLRVEKSARVKIDVTLITKGEFLGSEDVVAHRPYSYTCICHSTTGELMSIAKRDFFQLLGNEETLIYLSSLGKQREEYRKERLKTATKIEKEKRAILLKTVGPSKSLADLSCLSGASFHLRKDSDLSLSPQHSRAFSQTLASALEQSGIYATPKSAVRGQLTRKTPTNRPIAVSSQRKSLASLSGFHSSARRLQFCSFSGFLQSRS